MSWLVKQSRHTRCLPGHSRRQRFRTMACPYRFFLQAVHRLTPREEPVAIEVIDPLTRGSLFHHVQFKVLTALRDAKLLPINPKSLEKAIGLVDDVLDRVALEYEDDL